MRLALAPFNGLLPRYDNQIVRDKYASKAVDVDLRHGDLRPWRELKQLQAGQFYNGYYCDCNIVPMELCETVTQLTGTADYKIKSGIERAEIVCSDTDVTLLAPPYSDTPPNVTVLAPPSGNESDVEKRKHSVRTYAYSYVDQLGRESLLSVESIPVEVNDDGVGCVVDGFIAPSTEHGQHSINIYRKATGYRSGGEDVIEDATTFLYVGTVSSYDEVLFDSTLDSQLGDACTCEENYPPDRRLRGIKLYEPSNQLVGYFKDQVHLSAGNSSHIFPIEYQYTFSSKNGDFIKNILPSDDGVYVFTKYKSYLITNITCDPKSQYVVVELDIPKYVGKDDRSLMNTRVGPIINTLEGMLLLNGRNFTNLTAPWFTTNDWKQNDPESIKLGFYEGYMFIASINITYLLYMDNNNGEIAGRELTTISDLPNNFIKSPTGQLVMLKNDGAFQWDAGNSLREYLWELKNTTQVPVVITKAVIDAEGSPNIKVNGMDLMFKGLDEVSHLRNKHKTRRNTITFTSKDRVTSAIFGSSIRELRNVRS